MELMEIAQAIKELISGLPDQERALLKKASFDLSGRYRDGSYQCRELNKLERYAYLLARLPATKASATAVLSKLEERLPLFRPTSIADIGAGPATASWAAKERWSSLKEFQFIEKDKEWIKLGQDLAKSDPVLATGQWVEHDLTHQIPIKPADLVIAAYSFQELSSHHFEEVSRQLFLKANKALVIIEPGTPRGFANLHLLRKLLIEQGAHVLAPCVHEQSCPMQGSDWCHFSTRLMRDKAHRQLKDASVAFEDEKYAYLIVSREFHDPLYARVIRPPIKRSGHIIVDLCSAQGLTRAISSRSNKTAFKEAKKLAWGSPVLASADLV